jgi:hypothetical protein
MHSLNNCRPANADPESIRRSGTPCYFRLSWVIIEKLRVGMPQVWNQPANSPSYGSLNAKEIPMKKLVSAILAAVFALSSVSVLACGDKAKDEKQMSTPSKPKI